MVSAETELEIPFHDIDPMNVAWHGRYPKYFEIARSCLLDKIELNFEQIREFGFICPIVDMRIKYIRPLTLNQKVRIRCEIVEWEYHLKIKYEIFDKESGQKLCKAHTTQMSIDIETKETCFETPSILKQRISEYNNA
ncbi:MAG: acyl-CoA thioesterase [Agarilytica sp.]